MRKLIAAPPRKRRRDDQPARLAGSINLLGALNNCARSFGPQPRLLRGVGYLQNRCRSAGIAHPVYLNSRKVEAPDGCDPIAR
jgi:hypothetical protein